MTIRIALVTAIVLAACAKGTDDHARAGGSPLARSASPSPRWCWDTVEVRALTCSQQTARRSGDTLRVRLANGREAAFVDDPVGEAPGGYHYVGRIPRPPVQVVQQYGHESAPRWIFVSEVTGGTVTANDQPILSPDSARFVTAAQPDWDNCSEREHPSLDVWRFADTLPILEWRLDPWDCRRQEGWGPTDPHWRGPDTLEFVHNNRQVTAQRSTAAPTDDQRVAHDVAIRTSEGWHIVTR